MRCTADAPLRSRTLLPATGGSASQRRLSASHRRLLSRAAAPASSIARSRSPPGLSAESRSLKGECKAERCRRIEAAKLNLDILKAPTSIIPCTRIQWESWLGVNIHDFRRRMRKDAAPQRRRDFNIRLDKRPGLPIPAVGSSHRRLKKKSLQIWGNCWRGGLAGMA